MGYHVSQEEMEKQVYAGLERRARGELFCQLLKLEYVSADVEKGELVLKHTTIREAANPAGKLHGGIIAWLMDSTMGVLSRSYTGFTRSVTMDIHVNYLRAIDIGDEMVITARITHAGRAVVNICSEATVNGKICATADAIFFKIE